MYIRFLGDIIILVVHDVSRFLLNSDRLTAAEYLFILHVPQRGESLRLYANLAIITHDFLNSTLSAPELPLQVC